MNCLEVIEPIQLALRYHLAGELAQAEGLYRQILSQNPGDFDALHLLGVIAQQTGKYEAAIDLIGRAILLRPDFSAAHTNLGNALICAGRLDEAIESYRKAVEFNPEMAEGHFNLGKGLADRGENELAAESYRRAIELYPDYAEAHGNLGAALACGGDIRGALASYRRAIELKPESAEAHSGLGFALLCDGKIDEAIASCRRAMELDSEFGDGHRNLSLALLTRGEFAEGLKEYEWRTRLKGARAGEFNVPQWKGEELGGKTILLHSEQGFGDTIHFARYVPLVARRGGRVILACPPVLGRLLGGLSGVERVLTPTDAMPEIDFHCPLPSLPLAFSTRLDSIPAEIPYLKVDPVLVERWRSLVGDTGGGLKVGLVWLGRATPAGRSIPLRMLAPLAEPHVRFFSLQVGAGAEEAKRPPAGMKLVDLTARIEDFADAAGVNRESGSGDQHRYGSGDLGGGAWEAGLGFAEARGGLAVGAGADGFASVSDDAIISAGEGRGLGGRD